MMHYCDGDKKSRQILSTTAKHGTMSCTAECLSSTLTITRSRSVRTGVKPLGAGGGDSRNGRPDSDYIEEGVDVFHAPLDTKGKTGVRSNDTQSKGCGSKRNRHENNTPLDLSQKLPPPQRCPVSPKPELLAVPPAISSPALKTGLPTGCLSPESSHPAPLPPPL